MPLPGCRRRVCGPVACDAPSRAPPSSPTRYRTLTAPVLVHAGYHKTASTWLQHQFFVADNGWGRIDDDREVRRAVVLPRELDYDPAHIEVLLRRRVDDARARSLLPVISDERLSGHPHSGGYDSLIVARRLKQLVPDARLLLVVREQVSMARACWSQYVQFGGTFRVGDYLDPVNDGMVPLFSWGHLEYDRLVHAYHELFGAARVLVLPFELFVAQRDEFLARVYAHMEVEPRAVRSGSGRSNPSLPPFRLYAKRWGNIVDDRARASTSPRLVTHRVGRKVAVGIDLAADRVPRSLARRADRRLADAVAAVAAVRRERFAASNRRLESLTGLDLGRLGYSR